MDVKGMSFDEASKILEQMRLEAEAHNRPDQTAALDIARKCLAEWSHYKRCLEDDLK